MSKLGYAWSVLFLALVSMMIGCAGGGAPMAPSAASNAKGGDYGPSAGAAPASPPAYGQAAPAQESAVGGAAKSAPPSATAGAAPGAAADMARKAEAPAPESRPGLGTAWGETRESRTSTAPFVRDNPNNPFQMAAIYYNDREGANAMARSADYRAIDRGVVSIMGGALTVSLRDDSGRVLPGFSAGGKQYMIGEAGSRYVILVQNNTGFRFECVGTVDGLDVIDGRPGSFTKRGYLVQPYSTLEIEGFRRSAEAVAAFRFSSVRGSYANRSGSGDANVGVIGIALFNERGTNPTWTPEEVNRRHNADPFPGRYATPPSN
ncbi:MAG: hypothetical protein HY898_19960 [Deltaproteobacteria bacterium]|nr:hypothetical protein [Deltaproteobacteria bacterium]